MGTRLIAWLHPDTPLERRVLHYSGAPPEVTGRDDRTLMGWPRFVVLEESPGGVTLMRVTEKGDVVGDTWHRNAEEARRQIQLEYGDHVDTFEEIPSEATDPVAFALARLRPA